MNTDAQATARRPVITALGLICAAQFVLQLDFSIVNVALPIIQRELGFAAADLQWVVTAYTLTFGALLLLGGRLGDLLGRRRLLVLILSRLVQGAAGPALAAHSVQAGASAHWRGRREAASSQIFTFLLLFGKSGQLLSIPLFAPSRVRQNPFHFGVTSLPQFLRVVFRPIHTQRP